MHMEEEEVKTILLLANKTWKQRRMSDKITAAVNFSSDFSAKWIGDVRRDVQSNKQWLRCFGQKV